MPASLPPHPWTWRKASMTGSSDGWALMAAEDDDRSSRYVLEISPSNPRLQVNSGVGMQAISEGGYATPVAHLLASAPSLLAALQASDAMLSALRLILVGAPGWNPEAESHLLAQQALNRQAIALAAGGT